jgi:hypothetical protein
MALDAKQKPPSAQAIRFSICINPSCFSAPLLDNLFLAT